MKKLYKKQRLIGFIAILIVAIILAIVITTNIISKNHQVASQEDYLATTANANSNLVASYIKEGITIGGITGTLEILDTSDANATPEDIVWGETAYVKGEKITGTKVVTVAQGKTSQKTFEENTNLIDDYGNRVKVPAGFKVAEDSATSVTGGVVIEDVTAGNSNTKGSQFVWIPVGDIKTNNSGSITKINFGRYNFYNQTTMVQLAENWSTTSDSIGIPDPKWGGNYKELANSSYNNVNAKNLEGFVTSTKSAGGYYIGRFEAGDTTAINSSRTASSSDTNPVACKKGIYPYTFVNQSQAANLSRNMYNNTNYTSDLINSYAWDTAIVFIQTFSGDSDYSQQVPTQNTLVKCGESKLDNGYDERCNIFDMAGSAYEWSTETCSFNNGGNPCTARGGDYGSIDIKTSSGSRTPGATGNSFSHSGFRPILYL